MLVFIPVWSVGVVGGARRWGARGSDTPSGDGGGGGPLTRQGPLGGTAPAIMYIE